MCNGGARCGPAGKPERLPTMTITTSVMCAACLASLLLAGCERTPTAPAQSSGTFILYSIDPDRRPKDEQEAASADAAGERFRGFYVLGEAAVDDSGERAKLLGALRDASLTTTAPSRRASTRGTASA